MLSKQLHRTNRATEKTRKPSSSRVGAGESSGIHGQTCLFAGHKFSVTAEKRWAPINLWKWRPLFFRLHPLVSQWGSWYLEWIFILSHQLALTIYSINNIITPLFVLINTIQFIYYWGLNIKRQDVQLNI